MLYLQQPEGFTPDKEIVGCVIKLKGKILLLHRCDNKLEGNKWGLPGGKVDKEDADIKKAILREVKEETGISLDEESLFFHRTFFVSHLGFSFYYHYFNSELKELPNLVIFESEHKSFAWVTPEEALEMPLVLDEDFCLKEYFGIK